MPPKQTVSLKDLRGIIRNMLETKFAGRSGAPSELREIAYRDESAYREIVNSPDVAAELQRLGEVECWGSIQNSTKRIYRSSLQFKLGDLPGAPEVFQIIPLKNYVPVAEESEEGAGGYHVEAENMTSNELEASSKFYFRKGEEVKKRGENLRQVIVYREAMGIAPSMTLLQWKDAGFPGFDNNAA